MRKISTDLSITRNLTFRSRRYFKTETLEQPVIERCIEERVQSAVKKLKLGKILARSFVSRSSALCPTQEQSDSLGAHPVATPASDVKLDQKPGLAGAAANLQQQSQQHDREAAMQSNTATGQTDDAAAAQTAAEHNSANLQSQVFLHPTEVKLEQDMQDCVFDED